MHVDSKQSAEWTLTIAEVEWLQMKFNKAATSGTNGQWQKFRVEHLTDNIIIMWHKGETLAVKGIPHTLVQTKKVANVADVMLLQPKLGQLQTQSMFRPDVHRRDVHAANSNT